jgi:hypothetical protein
LPSLFPISSSADYAALPCPHGIDGAACRRRIDIYFLLIRSQARFKILCICIALRYERVPTIPQRHAPIRRPMPSNRGGAAGVQLKRGQMPRKDLERGFFGLRLSQPLEIPQDRQNFLWKCLEKTSRFGKAWKKRLAGSPLFRRLCRLPQRRGAGLEVAHDALSARAIEPGRGQGAFRLRSPH